MSRIKYSSYAYADAYTAGLAGRLLAWSDLSELASCRDVKSASDALAGSGYEEKIRHEQPGEYENAEAAAFIKRERALLHDMICGMVPSPEVFDAYFLQADYHNAKVCLKAAFLGIDPHEKLMEAGGVYQASDMVRMTQERDDAAVPNEIRDAASEASESFRRSGDPRDIDTAMDRACFRHMAASAARSGEAFIEGFVKLQIDLCNLRTIMRVKAAEDTWQLFHKVFISGGNIGEEAFRSVYEEKYEQSASVFDICGHVNDAGGGLKEAFEHVGNGMPEKYCDDRLMEYCRQAKYQTFGPVPVAGYIYGKKTELQNLRIIFAGISAGESAEKIRERLRIPYVQDMHHR